MAVPFYPPPLTRRMILGKTLFISEKPSIAGILAACLRASRYGMRFESRR